MAVERLLQLEIPPQAQWMRVMLCELSRIGSHLIWLGTHALDIGAMSVYFYCFREREEILKIFEMFSGQRMMTSYIRIGGLALEPPRGWHKVIAKAVERLARGIDEYHSLLSGNPIWLQSHQRRRRACRWISCSNSALPGPMIRAAGVKMDARKDCPHTSYEKFDFEVPTRTENDVYARFEVRMEEMRQSMQHRSAGAGRHARRSLAGRRSAILLPDREKMKTQMESLIYHFKIVTEGFRVPEGSVYQVVESPRGELGYYVVSDGTANPHRVFMRTPSFGNLQALGAMLEGG